MIYKNLGHSKIKVSTICLGTMTWGEQNTENEAFQQMDMAFDYGVNFFDTAELYPIPPSEKTQGETSRIISRWIKSKNNRNMIISNMKKTNMTNKEIAKTLNISTRTVHRVLNQNNEQNQKFVLELKNQNIIKKSQLISMRN